MSEIGQHTGTTIIHSKMLANDPEFWNTEKAKALFYKIIPDSNKEWQKQYSRIKKHTPLSASISEDEVMCFCGPMDSRTTDNWKQKPPTKRMDLLNLFLLYGYSYSDINDVDFVFSRVLHLAEPSKCTSILDACFVFCSKHLDYESIILPIIIKKQGSPLGGYLDLALDFCGSDDSPRVYAQRLIDKGCFCQSEEKMLFTFFSHIYDIHNNHHQTKLWHGKQARYDIREDLKDIFKRKQKEINSRRKATGKTPPFSNNYLKSYKNLPDGFPSIISRFYHPERFLQNRKEYNQRDFIGRDYMIKLCLHYTMGFDEINHILDLLQMDTLSYKNALDLVIIFTVSQLEKEGLYDIDMQYDDIEKIITRSNALLSVFGDNYDTIQKEALKYFDGFKERR